MMESVYFTLTAVVLYGVRDWALQRVEGALGRRLENRSLDVFGHYRIGAAGACAVLIVTGVI